MSQADVASSSMNNHVSEIRIQLHFMILDEIGESFPKINASGRIFLIRFRTPDEEQNPNTYCITALTNYLVHDVDNRDLVGLRIRNTENVQDKVVGISYVAATSLNLMWPGACLGRSSKAMLGLDWLTD